MKRLPAIILLLLSFSAFSQIQKNQWLIGGNGAFSFAGSQALKTAAIQLAPNIGYFFINKMAGGLRVSFGIDTYSANGDKYRRSDNSIAPFVRYYFLPAAQKVNIFGQGAYGYAWSRYKDIAYSSHYTYHYNNFFLMAGPAIFLNEHTALEITVGYTYSTRGPVDSTITNKLQLGAGLQIHFGKTK